MVATMDKKRSPLATILWEIIPCICFVTALALAVIVFTDWIIPYPDTWIP